MPGKKKTLKPTSLSRQRHVEYVFVWPGSKSGAVPEVFGDVFYNYSIEGVKWEPVDCIVDHNLAFILLYLNRSGSRMTNRILFHSK